MFGKNGRNDHPRSDQQNENRNRNGQSRPSSFRGWDESDRGVSATETTDRDRYFGEEEHRSSNREYEDRGAGFDDSVYRDRESKSYLNPREFNRQYRPTRYNYGQGNYERQPDSNRRSGMTADFQSEGVYQTPEGIGRGFSEFQNPSSHFGKGPKGYQRSDARIHEEVCDALTHDHDVDASEIEVKVEGGTVILSGTVETRQAKRAAEACVDHVRGVHDVRNEITVKRSDANVSYNNTTLTSNTKPNSTNGRLQ